MDTAGYDGATMLNEKRTIGIVGIVFSLFSRILHVYNNQ